MCCRCLPCLIQGQCRGSPPVPQVVASTPHSRLPGTLPTSGGAASVRKVAMHVCDAGTGCSNKSPTRCAQRRAEGSVEHLHAAAAHSGRAAHPAAPLRGWSASPSFLDSPRHAQPMHRSITYTHAVGPGQTSCPAAACVPRRSDPSLACILHVAIHRDRLEQPSCSFTGWLLQQSIVGLHLVVMYPCRHEGPVSKRRAGEEAGLQEEPNIRLGWPKINGTAAAMSLHLGRLRQ